MTMLKPPLAFAGHKGAWHEELQTLFESLPNGATVVDVFGGSGICAHIAKSCRPDLRVVCNDFDEYAVRLSHVSETELLRQKLLNLLGRKETGKAYRKLCDNEIERVQEILNDWRNQYGFVDELSVSRWLFLYPMNKDRISKKM